MNHIKRKIKKLESKMNTDRIFKEQKLLLLKSYLRQPAFLAGALIVSLGVGYFIARRKGVRHLLHALIATPLFVVRTARNVQMLSWLI